MTATSFSEPLFLDCNDRGTSSYSAIRVPSIGGRPTVCVFDEALKTRVRFHAAVFADDLAFGLLPLAYERSRRWALLQESPTRGLIARAALLRERFDHILTFDKELLAEGPPFERLLYGTSWVNRGRPPKTATYEKTSLVSFVGSIRHPDVAGYGLRRRVAQICAADSRIECWGRGIRNFVAKEEAVAPYRFSICMENTRSDFYFTEKLVDCIVTDTIPVYWGCRGISEILDPRGMIIFNEEAELRDELCSLSPSRYEAMIPYCRANRERLFDLKLTGHETLYERIVEQIVDSMPEEMTRLGVRRAVGRRLVSRVVSRIRRQVGEGIRRRRTQQGS